MNKKARLIPDFLFAQISDDLDQLNGHRNMAAD
jgi:hypothetical protein